MSESDKEELEVDEQIVFSSNYFGGNYTSRLTDRETGKFFAFVDFNADDVGRIRECPHCLEYEIHNKLQPRILEKGQVKPPDYDQFLSCYECGNTFPIYETHFESKIKDSLETTDNTFEGNESIFLSTDNRATQRKNGKKPRSNRFKSIEEHEDPEIQREIQQHGEQNVRILQGA